MDPVKRPLALVPLAVLVGCGGGAPPPPKPVELAVLAATSVPASWAAAQWDYHPPAPENFRAYVRSPDGGCVLVADGGQRWSTTPARRGGPSDAALGPCPGLAQASSALAPEDLVAVIHRAASSWAFVGESGAVYEVSDPLAPLTRAIAPPEPLRKVTGAGGNLVAVAREGGLYAYADETGWVAAPKLPLPVLDVALAEGGAGLALALPEALFATRDGGRTWAPALAPKTVGASRLGRLSDGSLVAEGLYESLVWEPARGGGLVPRAVPLEVPPEPTVDSGRAPSASATLFGRAHLDEDRYAEIVRAEQEVAPWVLYRGRLEGRLTALPLQGVDDCQAISFGMRGKHVVLVCSAYENDELVGRVMGSVDRGEHFTPWGTFPFAESDSVEVAVAPDGTALVVGLCKSADTRAPGCVLLLRNEWGKHTPIAARVAGVRGLPVAPTFSVDGRSAYVLGRRTKDEQPALFVSHDGGESFAERALEAPTGTSDPNRLDDGLELPLAEGASIQATEDGSLGVTLSSADPAVHLVLDEDGRLVRVASPPVDGAVMAGFGRRLVAVGPRDKATEMARGFGLDVPPEGWVLGVWESQDGGASWTSVSAPLALHREYYEGVPGLVCAAGGCLVGETVARVGWGGAPESARTSLLPPSSEAVRVERALSPIQCELEPTSKWTRIEHVYGRDPLPTEDDAMRGRAVWSVVTYDRATGVVATTAALLPESGDGPARIQTRTLLGRPPAGSHPATRVSLQMEGYAAVRMPEAPKGPSERWGGGSARIEIAWENWMDGTSGRRVLDGNTTRGSLDASLLRTGLVSVSPSAIFVQAHVGSPLVHFLDAAKGVDRFDYPLWPAAGLRGDVSLRSDDAAYADQTQLAVGFVEEDNERAKVLLLAARPAGAATRDWPVSAMAMAPSGADLPGIIDWTYAGARLGVTAFFADPERGRAWAYFTPFRGTGTFGPAEPLPTHLDLPPEPRGCTASERATTARTEAPLFLDGRRDALFPGLVREVRVVETGSAKDPKATTPLLALRSASAVLHGTPSAPCVAAFHAEGREGASGPVAVATISGDFREAWLFRKVLGAAPASGSEADAEADATLEVRPMKCRFDGPRVAPRP